MIKSALITGFFGDIGLQIIVNNSNDKNTFGLKSYFDQHGSLESAFLASGMMGMFFMIYKIFDPSFYKIGLCLYGGGLDILFRKYHKIIFPSLTDYYKTLSPVESVMWGIIPIIITIGTNRVLFNY